MPPLPRPGILDCMFTPRHLRPEHSTATKLPIYYEECYRRVLLVELVIEYFTLMAIPSPHAVVGIIAVHVSLYVSTTGTIVNSRQLLDGFEWRGRILVLVTKPVHLIRPPRPDTCSVYLYLRRRGEAIDDAEVAELAKRCKVVETLLAEYHAEDEMELPLSMPSMSSLYSIHYSPCSSPMYSDRSIAASEVIAAGFADKHQPAGRAVEDIRSDTSVWSDIDVWSDADILSDADALSDAISFLSDSETPSAFSTVEPKAGWFRSLRDQVRVSDWISWGTAMSLRGVKIGIHRTTNG